MSAHKGEKSENGGVDCQQLTHQEATRGWQERVAEYSRHHYIRRANKMGWNWEKFPLPFLQLIQIQYEGKIRFQLSGILHFFDYNSPGYKVNI